MYSEEDNTTWNKLFTRQMNMVKGRVCKEFLKGIERLNLPSEKVPDREKTSEKLQELGSWKLVPAEQEYLTDKQWANHFRKKEFPVTDYIRKPDELDFTPLPDIAHDFFGHLPFLAVPEYMEIIELFSEAYKVTPEDKLTQTAQLWWNTMEFGLIKENRETKILGAGLISSPKELEHCKDKAKHIKFELDPARKRPKAKFDVHNEFFVIESWNQLKTALKEHIGEIAT